MNTIMRPVRVKCKIVLGLAVTTALQGQQHCPASIYLSGIRASHDFVRMGFEVTTTTVHWM